MSTVSRTRPTEYQAKRLPNRVVIALRETAWLEKMLRWQNNGLTWEGFATDPAKLQLAQLHLAKVGRPRQSLAWLERRQFNLQMAYRLQNLVAQPQTAAELTAWLLAEAVCLDILPFPIAAKLVTLRAAALAPLQQFIASPGWFEARALAALVLGAICAKLPEAPLVQPVPTELKPFFDWGVQQDLPPDPAFYVRLLADQAGHNLADRYQAATQHRNYYRPSQPILHALLFEKSLTPPQVVALVEASRPIPALIETIQAKLVAKISFPYYYGKKFQEYYQNFLVEFSKFKQEFQQFIISLTEYCKDGQVLKLAVLHTKVMLELLNKLDCAGELEKTLLQALQPSLSLSPELVRPYLELLIEQHTFFWKPTSLKAEPKRGEINSWLATGLTDVAHMCRLLKEGQNPALIREIIELDVLTPVSACCYQHPAQLKELLWFVRHLKLQNQVYLIPQLGRFLCKATPEELKKYWRPLGEVLRGLPHEQDNSIRHQQLKHILQQLSLNRHELRGVLTSFLRHSSAWLALVLRSTYKYDWLAQLIGVLAEIDRHHGQVAATWVETALNEIEAAYKAQQLAEEKAAVTGKEEEALTVFYNWQLVEINLVALTLAAGDLAAYKALFRIGLHNGLGQDRTALEKACRLISKLPTVRAAMGRVLADNYQPTIRLLVKFGEVSRLQPNRLTPLGQLGGSLAWENFPVEWQELVQKYPELENASATYLHLRGLSGATLEIPAGLQRELELPLKLKNELAFLTAAALTKPTLQKRLENLQTRLADTVYLEQQVRAAAGQKLAFLADLALLQAAHTQIKKCYQIELAILAPPAQQTLALAVDENILNALQMFANITKNRPLLLRLLRMKVQGEQDWRAAMPGNRQFITEFTEQGKNSAIWLAENRQIFSFNQQQIQLYMETDPFQVLQMGNHFGTCLSADGFNAFSAVTNACDFNKRIIYAQDEKGKVIARKLIAITAKWQMVGFQTYTGLENEKLNAGLRRLFNQYCRELAVQCNLELSEDGCCEVARLVTKDWYDDGAVEWSEPTDQPKATTPAENTAKLKTPDENPASGVLNSKSATTAKRRLVAVG